MGFLDSAFEFVSTVVRGGDGSTLTIKTDKPAYYAGDTVTGVVVATLMSPRQAEQVVVRVVAKEKVEWDDERVETIFEGEGEQRKSRTVYHHHEHRAKHHVFKDLIIVSSVNHILPAGVWSYPFTYVLNRDAPGCVKFASASASQDPHWRHQGRQNHVKAKIVYSFKAAMKNGQVFSRDVKGTQEVVVNSFFEWAKMRPAHAERQGTVWLCCCIPRGQVTVTADFDKSAYAGGETAHIKAVIDNTSKRCAAWGRAARAGARECGRASTHARESRRAN